MGALFMVFLLTVFVLCADLGFCIYEDQVGLTDWHGEYVGEVKNAVFHTQKPGRKRVIVSTEENVVASLDLRHGKIFWRHVLGTDDRIDDLGVAFGKYVITLSSARGILRAWNLPDGQMVWESCIHGSSNLMLSILDKGDLIFVYGAGSLHAISSTGEVVWMKNLAEESTRELHLQHIIKEGDSLYAVGLVDFSDIVLWKIHSATGEVLQQRSASSPVPSSLSLVSGDTLAALDAARQVLAVIRIGDGEISLQEVRTPRLIRDFSGGDTATTMTMSFPKLAGVLRAKSGERTVLARIPTPEGEPEIVYETGRHAVLSDALAYSDSERALAVAEQEGTTLVLRVVLLRAGDFITSAAERIEVDGQSGHVQKVFINNYVRTDRSHGFRTLLVMEDHSLLLVQQGEIVWRRHDGLASIVATTTHDRIGSKKLIIVLTRAGRLYALHTGDGHVVWSLSLTSAADLSIHPVNPSTALVIGRGPSTTVLLSVDITRGEEIARDTLPFHVAHVISLPFASPSAEQHLHLLIDSDGNACLHRPAPDFESRLPNIYWHSVDTDAGVIRGYGLKRGDGVDTGCFESREIWTVVLDGKIAATAAPDSREVVRTQVRPTADQDAMFKYVSKNALFVATVGDDPSASSRLVAYVLDTVTGRVIHRASHIGSRGPVHAVFSENWVVYHYFNLRARKHEVSVVEMYDESRAENKDVWKLVSGKHDLTAPRTSHSHPRVTVKSQSYFFPHSLKSISVTLTSGGVTSKQVLLSTVHDQVVAVDRRYLDAHRSADPSRSEREGTIPLADSSSASLPIGAASYVTHAARVEGLRGVVTMPATLESTVLVFAYGLDLFFTSISPSRTYDSLTPDFSYGLLLVTVAALLIAIAIVSVLFQNKDLQDKWR